MSAPGRRGVRPRLSRRRRAAAAATALAWVAAFAFSLWPHGGAPPDEAAMRRRFLEAARAAEEGRAREAARLYEGLVRGGRAPMEVFYNLGNAHFVDGRVGPAVLNYRRAWRLAPRDPDIGANLRVALQATGAAEADLSGAEIVFTRISEQEWALVAAAAWWTACLLLGLGLLLRERRWVLVRLAVPAVAACVAALIGLWTWRGFERRPELVVLSDTQNALRAPEPGAPPEFSLAEGSVVRAREQRGEWVRVSYGPRSGWLRRAACAPVLPEEPPG